MQYKDCSVDGEDQVLFVNAAVAARRLDKRLDSKKDPAGSKCDFTCYR
jgi:hypothetical protein